MASTFFVQKISADAPFLIGRGKDVDFELKDASVSRHHAKIECRDGHWIFTNLSQTSGTLFDGKNIDEKEICHGDVFLLGLQQIRFSLKQRELSLSHVRSVEDVPAIPLSKDTSVLLRRGTNDDEAGTILHPACPKVLAQAKLEGKRLKLVFIHQRLHKTQNIRENLVHQERFYVEYDEFQLNRPENRLVKSTLLYLNKKSNSDSNLAEIRRQLMFFEQVDASVNYEADFSKGFFSQK